MARRWRWWSAAALGIFVLVVLASQSRAIASEFEDIGVGGVSVGVAPDAPRARLVEDTFLGSSPGMTSGNVITCKRYVLPPASRWHGLLKFAHSRRVLVTTPTTISRIESCFHRNATLDFCQCSKENWKAVEKEKCSTSMSPFEQWFIDVRSDRKASIKEPRVTVSVKEEFCLHRVLLFVLGVALLVSAPYVSDWVPFYYSSGMTLGIILVVLIILFQAMKLLPLGRKSNVYILIYGSMLGFGALLVRYISLVLSPLFAELGLGEDMVKPVALFCIMGILTVGAYLGYWGVRKFILTSDGEVDSGTAKFVKWTIRIFGSTVLLQTSPDPVFSFLALIVGILLSMLRFKRLGNMFDLSWAWPFVRSDSDAFDAWRYRKQQVRLWKKKQISTSPFGAPSSSYHTPVTISGKRVFVSPPAAFRMTPERTFYSTFHTTPERNKLTRAEREALARQCTSSAMKELFSSPNFAEWAIDNADRISVLSHDVREERPENEIEQTATML